MTFNQLCSSCTCIQYISTIEHADIPGYQHRDHTAKIVSLSIFASRSFAPTACLSPGLQSCGTISGSLSNSEGSFKADVDSIEPPWWLHRRNGQQGYWGPVAALSCRRYWTCQSGLEAILSGLNFKKRCNWHSWAVDLEMDTPVTTSYVKYSRYRIKEMNKRHNHILSVLIINHMTSIFW